MKFFTSDFNKFFIDLAENNNRDWFHANKKRYEESVKEPFKAFTQEMITRINADDPEIDVEPKNCIFRINRDLRFTKDKTPYKMKMGAVIAKGGKKDNTSPGVYFELSPEHVRIYGGVYQADKETLYRMREYMAKNTTSFNKILNNKDFTATFGELHGDKNKIIPKEFREAAEKQPLIFNKAFYYYTTLKPSLVAKEELCDVLMEKYFIGKEMKEFLAKAIE